MVAILNLHTYTQLLPISAFIATEKSHVTGLLKNNKNRLLDAPNWETRLTSLTSQLKDVVDAALL